jgi:hypothetical protein
MLDALALCLVGVALGVNAVMDTGKFGILLSLILGCAAGLLVRHF